jgi:hypothetical protein
MLIINAVQIQDGSKRNFAKIVNILVFQLIFAPSEIRDFRGSTFGFLIRIYLLLETFENQSNIYTTFLPGFEIKIVEPLSNLSCYYLNFNPVIF